MNFVVKKQRFLFATNHFQTQFFGLGLELNINTKIWYSKAKSSPTKIKVNFHVPKEANLILVKVV
jgi:ribosomal protein L31E